MKLLVCGGRNFDNKDMLDSVLDNVHDLSPIKLLIHGAAPGADSLAAAWARDRGVMARPFPADWHAHGKSAGPIRNRQMIKLFPDTVIAFPGGRGTQDMISVAKSAGVFVVEIPKGGSDLDVIVHA